MHIFSGQYKGRKLLTPKGLETRPTSGRLREALFNICQCDEDTIAFLDLFAGSGAVGLEALSRGVKHATFVDNSRESIRCIQKNISTLAVEDKSCVIYGNVFDVLDKLANAKKTFDIIYADPPYGIENLTKDLLKKISELDMLSLNGSLFIEDSIGMLPDNYSSGNFQQKSVRQMGRASLWHYTSVSKKTNQGAL